MPPFSMSDEFVKLLTNCQDRLYAYIVTLMGNRDQARDVLQETNIVLWRKVDSFKPGTDFHAWACKIAYYQVLAARRDATRSRIVFNDKLVEVLSTEVQDHQEGLESRRRALQNCIDELPARHRQLIQRRYLDAMPLKKIASELGRTVTSTTVALYRIRLALLQCVRARTAETNS